MNETLKTEDVTRVVRDVFSSMLSMDVVPTNGDSPPPQAATKVSASVGITGDWNGALTLECDHPTACFLAGAMLESDPFPALDDDVRDVLGEIVNILGGNIKGILEGHSSLSLPMVVEGTDYNINVINGQELVRLPLTCQDKSLMVVIVNGIISEA